MAKQVQAPIAVTNAAFTPINAAAYARYVEISEDGSGAAQGLVVQWPNGNVSEYPPYQQPIKIGNPGGGAGPFVGVPAQPSSFPGGTGPAATLYCSIKSMGAATAVRVEETN